MTAARAIRRLAVVAALAAAISCSTQTGSCGAGTASSAAMSQAVGRGSTPGPAAAPAPVRVLRKADLTPNEARYGRAPAPAPGVTYQPDVVIVEGGPDIIKAAERDGMRWTIDARAPRARDLAVGKIAFVTGRCVGRVLSAAREGDNLNLILGPVELTEIFDTLDVSFNGEVDLEDAIHYDPPQFQGSSFPVDGDAAALPEWSASLPQVTPARSLDSGTPGGVRVLRTSLSEDGQAVSPGIPQRLNLQFYTEDLKTKDGPGATIGRDDHGVRLTAQVQIRVPKPQLDFRISIVHGRVDARIVLKNSMGIKLAFDSAVSEDYSGNLQWYTPVGDFSIPLGGPVPISVTVKQGFWVKTAFSAKKASFSAGGDYDFNADIGLVWENGKLSTVGPKGLTVRKSLMSNMAGVSLGPRGLVLAHSLALTAGLGAFEFTTGPRFDLGTSLGIAQGSNVGIVNCEGATLTMSVRGGVGWTIPKPVKEIVNFFLRLVRVREIEDHGGIQTPWQQLFNLSGRKGGAICGGSAG